MSWCVLHGVENTTGLNTIACPRRVVLHLSRVRVTKSLDTLHEQDVTLLTTTKDPTCCHRDFKLVMECCAGIHQWTRSR